MKVIALLKDGSFAIVEETDPKCELKAEKNENGKSFLERAARRNIKLNSKNIKITELIKMDNLVFNV